MNASKTRRPLYQQAVPEQKGPFFSHAHDDAKKKDDAFFQTKLAVNEPGDKHEQEADKVADKVMRKAEEKEKPEVQKKGEDKDKETDKSAAGAAATSTASGPKSAAEPLSHKDKTPANKDATGGNVKHGKDEAADRPAASQAAAVTATDHKDKAPDPKSPAGQAPGTPKDKLPGQGAGGQMTSKDEDPKLVSRKEAEHEEKPAIQKMSDNDKKEDDKTKVNKKEGQSGPDGVGQVMMKEAGGTHAAHKVSLEERIKQSKGKGQTLPDDVRAFLEKQLGADLGEVVIHTGSDAVAMNKELGSLAFTNGFDIYFNAGQYKPDTAAGQKLLAHELTHVLQQTGVSKKKEDKK